MLFTGQRLDDTGLYYYNARYYDPTIGRFISGDRIVQDISRPQTLNHYSYCINNPLKYNDPTGNFILAATLICAGVLVAGAMGYAIYNSTSSNTIDLNLEGPHNPAKTYSYVKDKIGEALNNAKDSTMSYFGKQGRGREAWEQHRDALRSMQKELKALQKALKRSKSPKERAKIQKDINDKIKQIKDHKKEMRQKWEDTVPQPDKNPDSKSIIMPTPDDETDELESLPTDESSFWDTDESDDWTMDISIDWSIDYSVDYYGY
jgi:RHS repeat-associated protein